MTGGEFREHLEDRLGNRFDVRVRDIIAREFDAALSAMTAERDAEKARAEGAETDADDWEDREKEARRSERMFCDERDRALAERDEARTMWNTQANELLVAREELQAANKRAEQLSEKCTQFAAESGRNRDVMERLKDEVHRQRCRAEKAGAALASVVQSIDMIPTNPKLFARRAAVALVMLRGECQSVLLQLVDAHAAVEALRTVKP